MIFGRTGLRVRVKAMVTQIHEDIDFTSSVINLQLQNLGDFSSLEAYFEKRTKTRCA